MTTETKVAHTPGPWFADVNTTHRNHRGGFSVESNSGVVICGRMGWPDRWEESVANARLLASAPRLLDALNGLVGLVQLIQMREPELQSNHRFIEALAAIEQAEGR